jgi:hypothetical protein
VSPKTRFATKFAPPPSTGDDGGSHPRRRFCPFCPRRPTTTLGQHGRHGRLDEFSRVFMLAPGSAAWPTRQAWPTRRTRHVACIPEKNRRRETFPAGKTIPRNSPRNPGVESSEPAAMKIVASGYAGTRRARLTTTSSQPPSRAVKFRLGTERVPLASCQCGSGYSLGTSTGKMPVAPEVRPPFRTS